MATVAKDFQTRNGIKAGGAVEGTTHISTVATGTAPLTISSTTLVTNLNADLLDGSHASAFGLVSGKLSQFAATSSSELAGVISDETGSGSLVFGTSPEITTSLTTPSTSFSLVNTTATTVNFAGAATTLSIGAATGTTTVNNNLTVSGSLVVNGTTTTINSTTQTLDDPVFTLGGDTAPTTDDNKDRGIEFRWHNGTAAKVGFFGFDDSTGYFTFIPDATNSSEVFSGTPGDIQATNFRGALVGNADTATSAGKWTTARTITLGGDLSGSVSIDGSANVTLTATVAADSVALGTDTTGNYVATITGTSNQVTVTGSGSESAAVTLSLPQNIHTTATPSFSGVIMDNAAVTSDAVTVSANSTPTTIDSFAVATYTSADYLLQAKQGTKMTSTHLTVMWDGTDVHVSEWGTVEATAGAANVTFTATHVSGTVSVTASSSDAASTNVVIKGSTTYIKA